MNEIMKIVEIVLPALLGGGISWVLSYRWHRRKMKNQVIAEEFEQVNSVVESFTSRIQTLAIKISDLVKKNMDIEEESRRLLSENAALKARLKEIQRSKRQPPRQ